MVKVTKFREEVMRMKLNTCDGTVNAELSFIFTEQKKDIQKLTYVGAPVGASDGGKVGSGVGAFGVGTVGSNDGS
jgi:hypothetical protein